MAAVRAYLPSVTLAGGGNFLTGAPYQRLDRYLRRALAGRRSA